MVISAGCPWAAITEVKNFVAALTSRLFDTNTSMTCPSWSTARQTYRQDPDTFRDVLSTNQFLPTRCRQDWANSMSNGVNCWTQQ